MKSLFISYDGALEPLGQSQIIPYLKGLSKDGISFVLLTFDKKYFLDRQEEERLYKQLEAVNIKWFSLRYHKRPAILSTFFDIIIGLILSMVIVKRDKIDMVHARGYMPAIISLSLKKIFKIKFIFDMRGFWADEKAESNHWNRKSILYKFTKYLEGRFIKNADGIVVLTKQAKIIIQSQGYNSSNIFVIPCCVDIDAFKAGASIRNEFKNKNKLNEKFIFAYTGSLEDWYMKNEMLDYFKTAKEIIPNAHFLILSSSPKDKILELIKTKRFDKNDFTITDAKFTRMPEYLSIVDAGIIFLSLGFSKSGCLPTKFAEFLSCGIPVICSAKIGDTEEIILSNKVGVIVNHFEEGEYRRTFLELLKLKADNSLGKRCREIADKEFSLVNGIDKYRGIYSRLINELRS